MQIDVITIFPKMFEAITQEGVIARAIKNKIVALKLHQLRDYSDNKYRNIDDKSYGGGAGMVMQVKPIRECLKHIKKTKPKTKVIYLSPQGQKLTHKLAVNLSQETSLTLLCGRYEGVDERIIKHDIDCEISIGDFVLSGGELPAMVLIDAVARQLKGVLGNAESLNDSFQNGLLDHPHYTRPEEIDGQKVPAVLLSGHQANIDKWRLEQAKLNTLEKYKK